MGTLADKTANLPPEAVNQWGEFTTKMGQLVDEVFGEDAPLNLVVGAQFAGMGQDENLPLCLVASNLPICYIPRAVEIMLEHAVELHEEVHPETPVDGPEGLTEVVGIDALPDEAQDAIRALAGVLGVDPSEIGVMQVADTTDLAGLPTTTDGPEGS